MNNQIIRAAGWLAVCAVALWIGPAGADIITISNDPNGNEVAGTDDGTGGQAFVPSVNDGYAGSPSVAYLKSVKFWSDGGSGIMVGWPNPPVPPGGLPNDPVYVHIYTNFFDDG